MNGRRANPRLYLVRAYFWPALLPIALVFGWQSSVFLVFALSLYSNYATDIGAYQAARARQAADTEEAT